jgi:hypothetical protein
MFDGSDDPPAAPPEDRRYFSSRPVGVLQTQKNNL